MKFVIAKDLFKEIIELQESIGRYEVFFIVDREFISWTSPDAAKYCMSVGKVSLESSDVESTVIAFDAKKMKSFLRIPKSKKLEVKIERGYMNLTCGSVNRKIPLIDPTYYMDSPKIPNLKDFNNVFSIKKSNLNMALKATADVGDILFVSIQDGKVKIGSDEGRENDEVNVEYNGDQIIALSSKGDAKSIFTVDYIASTMKKLGKDVEIKVSVGNDYPIQFDFKIGDEEGSATLIVAPRIGD